MSENRTHNILYFRRLLYILNKAVITNNLSNLLILEKVSQFVPIVEVIEPLVRKVLGGAVVEVGIKLVDHALIAKHRKKTDGKS